MKHPWTVTPMDVTGERGSPRRCGTELGALLARENFYRGGVTSVEVVNAITGKSLPDLPMCMGTGCEWRSSYAMAAMGRAVCWHHADTVTAHESLMHDLTDDDRRQDAAERYTRACAELGICATPLCWLPRTMGDRCGVHQGSRA